MSENTPAPEPAEPEESGAAHRNEAYLSEQDIRAIVRLLGEVAAIQTGHVDQKRYLLNGILRMVDGDVWVWLQGFLGSADRPPAAIQLLDEGWSSPEQRNWFYRLTQSHPSATTAPLAFIASQASPTSPIAIAASCTSSPARSTGSTARACQNPPRRRPHL